MKSEVKHNANQANPTFPRMMIDTSDNVVVLFFREGDGVVVSSGTNTGEGWLVGKRHTGLHMGLFTEFNGEVTLYN